MLSFRQLITLAEGLLHLTELEDTVSGGPPPVIPADEHGPDRRPDGGACWFHDQKKIMVANGGRGHTDFATVPFLQFQRFGFDPRAILQWLTRTGDKLTAEMFGKYLALFHPQHVEHPSAPAESDAFWRKNPAGLLQFSGARDRSIGYALSRGWAYIEWDEHEATLWLDKAQAKSVVQHAGDLFPMMTMEHIRLVLPSSDISVFVNKTLTFHKEDSRGFAGAYGALMQWAGGAPEPEQHWIFTIVAAKDSDRVDQQGLHPLAGQYVSTGNWTDRNVYTLPYLMRSQVAQVPAGATVYRFAASVVEKLGLKAGGEHEKVLLSKAPFVIPAQSLQRKTVSGWVAVA